MNIIHLGINDIPRVVPLVQEFWAEGFLPGALTPDHFIQTCKNLMGNGSGLIIAAELDGEIIGAIGAIMCHSPNDGALMAHETFWFVTKKHRQGSAGKKLLDTLEEFAKERGATKVMMIRLTDEIGEKLDLVYKAHGYKPVEVHYIKDLED